MSGVSSPISSAPTDATYQYHIASAEGRLRLYCPEDEDEDDQTVTILKAFAEILPREGASNIIDDILETDTDEKLRDLARHLHTAILSPSKFPGWLGCAPGSKNSSLQCGLEVRRQPLRFRLGLMPSEM